MRLLQNYCEITERLLYIDVRYGEIIARLMWGKCERIVSLLWDYCKIAVRLLWDYLNITARLLLNYFERLLWEINVYRCEIWGDYSKINVR